jgi:hypothetical protein
MTADLARYSLGLRFLAGLYTMFAALVVGLALFCAVVFGVVEDCAPEVEPEPMFIRDALVKAPASVPMIVAPDRCVDGWAAKVEWTAVEPMEPNS